MATASRRTADPDLDALLAAYAAGRLSRPMSALVASHLILSPRNRTFVAHLEAVHGAAVEASEPVPLPNRAGMLRAIFALPDDIRADPARSGQVVDALPPPLRRLLGFDLDRAPWRAVRPGLRECRVEEGPEEARLISIEAGRSLPPHSHDGAEAMLVLRGGFRDGGRFRRGDIAVVDAQVAHGAVADRDEDCLCFAVTDPSPRGIGSEGGLPPRR